MIAPRNWITSDDIRAVTNFLELGSPLSGYLAGNPWGGAAVQRLEELWCTKFNRKHAICCNSATSGLLAACVAIGVKKGMVVGVPALSMSATAAVPAFCGANLQFLDSDASGGISYKAATDRGVWPSFCTPMDVVIPTTLWGHPVNDHWGDFQTTILDNAQGIMSDYGAGQDWSENLAHISVTSFNVHKQINAGEGGIISTDDNHLADAMRKFINHGENAGFGHAGIGLNLRMTEIAAVLVLSQMARLDETNVNLTNLARNLQNNTPSSFAPILPLVEGFRSGHYCYAFQVDAGKRDRIVEFLNSEGVPAAPMYKPLYELPAFQKWKQQPDSMCPTAEHIAKTTIILELCAWRYEDDITNIGYALQKAAKL